MSQTDEPSYPHGDRQIARILQRAAELQAQDSERSGAPLERAAGVSLTELKQIASEVGIDPRHVEAAAAELRRTGEGQSGFYFWGAPFSTALERTIPGEVPADEWEVLVAKIRHSTGHVGRSSTLGRSLEWTGQTDHVSVSPRKGQTHIRILSRYADSTLGPHVSAGTASFLALLSIAGWFHGFPPEAVALTAVTAGGTFGLARVWARAAFRSRHDRLKALIQELAAHVERTAPDTSAERVLSEADGSGKESARTGKPLTVSRPSDA